MIELKDGINYHNFLLDTKPFEWFKKQKKESTSGWVKRTAYQCNGSPKREYTDDTVKIAISVLSFLRENKIEKKVFEELCGFELNLKGSHDWKLSEIRKLELLLNEKLV